MRTLKLHFPDDALPTLDTFIKQTKEARGAPLAWVGHHGGPAPARRRDERLEWSGVEVA